MRHSAHVALLVMGVACAAPRPVPSPRALTAEERDTARALGTVEAALPGAREETQRLRRLTELHVALGNREEAGEAVRSLVNRARVEAALSALGLGEPDATRSLDDAVDFAVGVAGKIRDHDLVLAAIGEPPPPGHRHAAAYRRAATTRYVDAAEHDVRALFQSDHEAAARREAAGYGDSGLAIAELARLGPRFSPVLANRLDTALREGRVADLGPLAEALLKLDHWHVTARLVLLLLADQKRGLLDGVDLRWSDLVPSSQVGTLVRLERARAGAKGAIGPATALAHQLIKAGLVGDAQVLLGAVGRQAESPLARETTRELVALCALTAFDRAPYDSWALASHGDRSSYLAEVEAGLLVEGFPEPLKELARRARRKIVERGFLVGSRWSLLQATAAASGAPRALRAAAISELEETDQGMGPLLAQLLDRCVKERLNTEACEDLMNAAWHLEEGEDQGEELASAFKTLAAFGNTPSRWLRLIHGMEAPNVAELAPWLEATTDTRLGVTEPHVVALALVDVARGNGAAVKERLHRDAPLLSLPWRLWLSLVADDLLASRIKGSEALAQSWLTPAWTTSDWNSSKELGAERVAEVEREHPATSHVGRLAQAVALAYEGDAARALAVLAPLLERAPEGNEAALWSFAAHLGARAGQDGMVTRALAGLSAARPRGAVIAQARAIARATSGDLKSRAEALRAWPSGEEAGRLLTALLQAPAGARELDRARAFLVALGPLATEYLPLRRRLEEGSVKDGESALRWARAISDPKGAWDLLPDGAREPQVLNSALTWLESELMNAKSPADARNLARTMAQRLPDPSRGVDRWPLNRMAWIQVLAGNGERALAMLARSEKDGQAAPSDAVLAARANVPAPGMTEAQAFSTWTTFRKSWAARPEEVVALARELSAGGATHAKLALACSLFLRSKAPDEALATCAHAWQSEGPVEPEWATGLSELVLSRPDEARARGLGPERFFAEAELRMPPGAGEWLHHKSRWLAGEGKIREAADAELEAQARGFDPSVETEDLFVQAPFRAISVRRTVARNYPDLFGRHASLAFTALRSGDLLEARAYYSTAARVRPKSPDKQVLLSFLFCRAVLQLAEADFAEKALDRSGLLEAMLLVDDERMPLDGILKLDGRYPRSRVVDAFVLEAKAMHGDRATAAAIGRKLIGEHPGNYLVGQDLVRLLAQEGSYAEARKARTDLVQANPEDPELTQLQVPDGPDGSQVHVPAVAKTARGYEQALAALGDADVDRIAPSRRASPALAAEAFLPDGWASMEDLTFQGPNDTVLALKAVPRASFCEGEACLDAILPAFEQLGASPLWKTPISLPAGQGYEAMLATRSHLISLVALPIGVRVYILMFRAPPERFEAGLAAWKLLRESFRPLDAVVSPARAERLRSRHAELPALVLAKARRSLARHDNARTCAVRKELDSLGEATKRGALLVDLFLSTGSVSQHRSLLACAAPTSEEGSFLGVLALLAEDMHVHAHGTKAIQAFPARALEDARQLLLGPEDTVTRDPREQDLPAHGLLEVVFALAKKERTELVSELVTSSTDRERSLGLVAGVLVPGALDRDTLRRQLTSGLPSAARLVAHGLSTSASDEDIAAARARIEGLKPPLAPPERALVLELGRLLAMRVDAQDGERLSRLPSLVLDGIEPMAQKDARGKAEELRWLADVHARALALSKKQPVRHVKLSGDDRVAMRWLASRNEKSVPAAKPRSLKELERAPLASLLPGDKWIFSRIGRPGLFAATAEGMFRRLSMPDEADVFLVRHFFSAMAASTGGRLLLEAGGLDLAEPMECASLLEPRKGFACSARVKDRVAVLGQLSLRRAGSSSGLALPNTLAGLALATPVAMPVAPVLLHDLLFDPAETTPQRTIAAERFRSRGDVLGLPVEKSSIVVISDQDTTVESDLVMLVGDRVLVFSDQELAGEVVATAPNQGGTLAESPRFQALAGGWTQGAALQAAFLGNDATGTEDLSVELVVDSTGLAFVLRSQPNSEDAKLGDVRALVDLLPPGAISTLALSESTRRPRKSQLDFLAASDATGPPPPGWLAAATDRFAFGWYSQPKDVLWGRWVSVMPLSAPVRRALADRGLSLSLPSVHDQVHFLPKGDFLVVGTPRDLVNKVLLRPKATDPGEKKRVGVGTLDGRAAAAVVRALAPAQGARADLLRLATLVLGATKAMHAEATVDARGKVVVTGRITPTLGETRVDLGVVDRSLATRALKNATRLPRLLTSAELSLPLRMVLEVDDAAAFATRAFPRSPRLDLEVQDPRHLGITVRPQASATTSMPLTAEARARLLSGGNEILVDSPSLVQLAKSLMPHGTPAAEAARSVVAWVHKHVQYEVTVGTLDAQAVLDRKRGDCTEFSVLTVSLLRAAGVPAEVRQGMAVVGREMVAHAWVAYHDGVGWREIDPTEGRLTVGSGHVEVAVLELISLVSLGRLKVVSVSPVTPAPAGGF
ncbi:MAG: lasso peptide biosynthesis protein [Deltaproteobacteria bacterium]|nr:lasso peptide biosynthesis protein [Deltaproteobacteria bacterium]